MILISVFLLSSILKAVNIYSFSQEVRMFIDAYMCGWMHSLSTHCAIIVCMTEMTIALLSLKSEYRRITRVAFCVILFLFVYLTGLNLFFPTIMGSIESCGCFGELIHFTPLTSFIKSAVLWGLALMLVVIGLRDYEPWHIAEVVKDKYLYVCIGVSCILPLYSLLCFEKMEHGWYVGIFTALCLVLCLIVVTTLRKAEEN